MPFVENVTFKIGPMRKLQDWVIYPKAIDSTDNKLTVQCDKRILLIDPDTKKGILSNGKGHPGFHALSTFCGAIEVDVPQEIIDLCTANQAQSGDVIGSAGGGVVRIL